MRPSNHTSRLLAVPAIVLLVAACGATGAPTPAVTAAQTPAAPATSGPAQSQDAGLGDTPPPGDTQSPDAGLGDTPPPDTTPTDAPASEAPGGTTSGDIPDNAVFLTYHARASGFSIQYVEGWQVTPQPAGVIVRDKDSSETVSVVAPQADVAAFVASTDLPALQGQPGFKLIKQDTVKVGGSRLVHLVFHQKSPPDSVTGKQVAQTVDRYYVPGTAGLAIVSLATPDGVDNVDAFRQMIQSFKWS